jgi:hypothetical protein
MSAEKIINKGGRPKTGSEEQIMLAKVFWTDYQVSNQTICDITKMNYRTLYRRLGRRNVNTGKKVL